jgi:prepilin-type N-terminal cleavage/methylation domain-containing protein
MTPERGSGDSGFALMELLVSLSLGLVALAAVPVALRVVGTMTTLARDGTVALTAAQTKIEELIAVGDTAAGGTDEPTSAAASFSRTWHVESPDPRIPARSITATVEWGDGAHRVTLESFAW